MDTLARLATLIAALPSEVHRLLLLLLEGGLWRVVWQTGRGRCLCAAMKSLDSLTSEFLLIAYLAFEVTWRLLCMWLLLSGGLHLSANG